MSEYIVRMPSDMPYEIKAELNAWYVEDGPIVRCRDCKRCIRYETWNPEGEAFNCNYWGSDTEPDGFCAWGERRDE